MTTKIKPMNGHVVLRSVQREQKTDGGILLPGGSADKNNPEGEVVAVADDVADLKAGDRIFFRPGTIHAAKIGGEVLMILEAKNITLKIEQ